HLTRLKASLPATLQQGEFVDIISDLKSEFGRMARAVEAVDLDQTHFELRPIVLLDWLIAMNGRYASQYAPIVFKPEIDANFSAVVLASDFLLETVFWNTWQNAHQAAGSACVIVCRISLIGVLVSLLILDNGPGFPEISRDVAFRERYSTNGPNRGRGLLE